MSGKPAALLLSLAILVGAAAAGENPPGAVAEQVPAGAADVLTSESYWRWYRTLRKPIIPVEALKAAGQEASAPQPFSGMVSQHSKSDQLDSPPAPGAWDQPGFDDGNWPRSRVSGLAPHSFGRFSSAALCLRGKFQVTDPAAVQGLFLTVKYYGGVRVVLNGREIARQHLPAGALAPETPAEMYPNDAYVDGKGAIVPFGDVEWYWNTIQGDQKKDAEGRRASRTRTLGPVRLPADALRKGENVLAIEVRRAEYPVVAMGWFKSPAAKTKPWWCPLNVLELRLQAAGAGAAPNVARPKGIQVWNCAPFDTVSIFDYGDVGALRPISVPAARNGVFSGRLVIGSDQAIKGLKVQVSDLVQAGGAKLPASAVRVRCAEPAVPAKTWAPEHRFDGLPESVPAEVPVVVYRNQNCGAVAPIWLTVRVPKDAKAGKYEGTVTVSADGLKPTEVPLKVDVSAWAIPDPKDFRVANFAYLSEDAIAKYYGVPMWSDRHFELMGKSMALMAEVNSRPAVANLAINFYGGDKGSLICSNEQSLVRWIRKGGAGVSVQPFDKLKALSNVEGVSGDGKKDGGAAPDTRNLTPETFSYDFTIFDKYLELVAKTIGKPSLLRVNCWGEATQKDGKLVHGGREDTKEAKPGSAVTLFDPATGRIEPMEQPVPGTDESYAFWKPVLDEVRKKAEARGWWDVTAMGHSSYCYSPMPHVGSVYKKIWPDGVWAYTAHNGKLGSVFGTLDKAVTIPVRYSDCVWTRGAPTARGYRALLKPRPGIWCYTYRERFREWSELTVLRDIDEEEIMSGHDGVSDFGADLFPIKNDKGRYYALGNGRGTGGPTDSTRMMLYPGPDGAVATERFEMLREGAELAEAILFIERALQDKKISGDLEGRANRCLDERGEAFLQNWLHGRFERDEKLLGLAGEVAAAVGGK